MKRHKPSVLVSYIVLNWRLVEKTLKAISGIKSQATGTIEVIIVDNESDDRSRSLLKEHADTLIANHTNLGFAVGCNQGAEVAKGKYLAFINNDAVLPANWQRVGIETIESKPHICAVAGGERISDNEQYSLSFVSPHTAMVRQSKQNVNLPVRVPYAYGSNLLISKKAFEEARGFEESYFAYYEDVDLGAKLHACGLESWYVPAMTIAHEPGSSTQKGKNTFRNRLIQVNKYRFMSRHYDKWISHIFQAILYDLAKFAIGSVIAWLRPQGKESRSSKLSVYRAQAYAAMWSLTHLKQLKKARSASLQAKHYSSDFVTLLRRFEIEKSG